MLTFKNRLFFILFIGLISTQLYPQSFSVDGQDVVCYEASQPLPLSQIFSINGDDSEVIQGIQITIESDYDRTDSFTFGGSGAITGDFDVSNGIMSLRGTATIAQYSLALQETFFHTSSPERTKSINMTISGVDFLVETGHFYQFFSAAGISWSDAKAAAEGRSLYGLQGYLTTITSTTENQFILSRVSGSAWIGASDEETENTWKWVTGPEAGQSFWNGLSNGAPINGMFNNWQTGEPNQSGEEDYAHMMDWTTPAGLWNDLPNAGGSGQYAPTGYIVEYGGMPGEPNVLEDLSKTIVLDPERTLELVGANSVCPNIQGVEYSITEIPNYTYNWTITGGSIVEGQNTASIKVNWGDTNPNASVLVEVASDLVCTYSINLDVVINEELEPPLPKGPSEVCFTALSQIQSYSVPKTNGSNYQWFVTNGAIQGSGQGSNKIDVLWDGPGTGEIYLIESTTTATDFCDGVSPVLSVELKEEIKPVVTIQNVSCFNGSDGMAVIQSVNGSDDFDVVWNTFGTGSEMDKSISGLRAGTYSAEITLNGCTINIPIIITQPDELIGSIETTNALCHGAANGTASVSVSGGTGSYRYIWSHNANNNTAFVGNIPKGEHSVEIRDDNECVLILNFDIDEPEPLKIDSISMRKVSCPGLADGQLEAFVSGGTPPYNYVWSGNSSSTAFASGFAQGEYQVVVTDANGCTTSDSQVVEEATPKIVLPNAFSPNGDSSNDTFRPANSCPVEYNLTVYSRWGTVIFQTSDITIGWDGTFEGSPAPQGKYSYFASWVIEANGLTITEEVRGELKLIR